MPAALISPPILGPFWGVVRSGPAKERFAAEQLGLRGFETFLPRVQTKRASEPLFRGYFFVRIIEQWGAINTTFGVLCLVRVGDCPARCPDVEIDSLKAMVVGGYVRLPEARVTPATIADDYPPHKAIGTPSCSARSDRSANRATMA